MKERPIIFGAESVRAILAGRKTQFRRPVKPQGTKVWPHTFPSGEQGWMTDVRHDHGPHTALLCPYGVPGDRLWVRETWGFTGSIPTTVAERCVRDRFVANPEWLGYRADHPHGGYSWCPSIHMPREFSRLLLEVTEVRVQRLQEISEKDAQAEGVTAFVTVGTERERALVRAEYPDGHRTKFRLGWDSINGKRAPWASNPWVWAITFRRAA